MKTNSIFLIIWKRQLTKCTMHARERKIICKVKFLGFVIKLFLNLNLPWIVWARVNDKTRKVRYRESGFILVGFSAYCHRSWFRFTSLSASVKTRWGCEQELGLGACVNGRGSQLLGSINKYQRAWILVLERRGNQWTITSITGHAEAKGVSEPTHWRNTRK